VCLNPLTKQSKALKTFGVYDLQALLGDLFIYFDHLLFFTDGGFVCFPVKAGFCKKY
jgi:hypothetical protein